MKTGQADPNRGETASDLFIFFKTIKSDLKKRCLKHIGVCSSSAPVKKGTDTVYSEVRNSKQGTANILLFIQIPLPPIQWEKSGHLLTFGEKMHQETGSAPIVNICIVGERMSHENSRPIRQVSTSCFHQRELPVPTIRVKQRVHPLRLSEQRAPLFVPPEGNSCPLFSHWLLTTPGCFHVTRWRSRSDGEQISGLNCVF